VVVVYLFPERASIRLPHLGAKKIGVFFAPADGENGVYAWYIWVDATTQNKL